MNAAQLGEQLHTVRIKWKTLWDSKPNRDFSSDELVELDRMNQEMSDLSSKYEKAKTAEETAARIERDEKEYNRPVTRLETPVVAPEAQKAQYKSFGSMLEEQARGLTDLRHNRVKSLQFEIPEATAAHDFGIKTLLASTDWDIVPDRQSQLIQSVQLPYTVSDLMMAGRTTSNAITYEEETTFTNAAVEVAEGDAKPESALDFTLRTDNVRKIATWIPVTDEMLEDVPQMESYVRARLGFMVQQRREYQLINGDGTAPNISGVLDRSTLQTQARGTDPMPDAVYKAMTKVRVIGGAEPTALVVHPNDWQDIRLLRTADGIYIWGSPAEAGPERIWGMTVRQTTAIAENTGLVGAFRPFAQVFRRTGLTVEMTRDYSTYRTSNKVLVIAEERLALAVYRGSAFCQITAF